MAYSCRICGKVGPARTCAHHRVEPRPKARATGSLRAAIIMRDHGICQICGNPVLPGTEHIDHMVARVNGGSTTLGNLRVTHRACNMGKDAT